MGTASGTACAGGDTGSATPVLGWYINPDNGGQAELAAACSAQSGGRYRISVSTLPNDASGQREQLVRRLAAKDRSIALMSLDPPFVAEFAEAGFLRAFSDEEAAGLTEGVLRGPVEGATWDGRLVAAPPGLEPGLAECLSGRLSRVVHDPEFAAAAEQARRALDFAEPAVVADELESSGAERLLLVDVLRRHAELARSGLSLR